MMIRTCLFLSLALHGAVAQTARTIIRLNFHFGFFDLGYTPSIADILADDVETLLCQTQANLATMIENSTGMGGVDVNARNIDWSYDETQEMPATVSFAIEVTDAGDAEVDNAFDVVMYAMDSFDEQAFILSMEGFFENTNSFAWDIKQELDPSTGRMTAVQCAVGVTRPPSSTTTPPANTAPPVSLAPGTPSVDSPIVPDQIDFSPTDAAEVTTYMTDFDFDDSISETVAAAAAAPASSAFSPLASMSAVISFAMMALFTLCG